MSRSAFAGGLISCHPRLYSNSCAQIRTDRLVLDCDHVDHAYNMSLILKALAHGQAYTSKDTTNFESKECLLIVAPIHRELSDVLLESLGSEVATVGDKRWLTLCFNFNREGVAEHMYHCCVQAEHPSNIFVDGHPKYAMTPVNIGAHVVLRGHDRYQLTLKEMSGPIVGK